MTYVFVFCIGFLCCAVLDILAFNHIKSKLIKQLEKECKYSGNDVYNNGIIYALNEIKKLVVCCKRGDTMIDDIVNQPRHYCTGTYECIDVMLETQGVEAVKAFCLCNAFKYIYRHNAKNGLEDIEKAVWYLNKYIELSK